MPRRYIKQLLRTDDRGGRKAGPPDEPARGRARRYEGVARTAPLTSRVLLQRMAASRGREVSRFLERLRWRSFLVPAVASVVRR